MTTILKMQRNNSYYFHLFPHAALSAPQQSGPVSAAGGEMDDETIRRHLDASKSVDITSPSEEDTDSDIEDSSSNDAGQESSSNDEEEEEEDSVAVESEGTSKPRL